MKVNFVAVSQHIDMRKEVFSKIKAAGGKVYFVGGFVRECVMLYLERITIAQFNPHDIDICVVGLNETEFEALFPGTKAQGKDFPVYRINGDEYALARLKRKIGTGHTGFETISNKELTIEDDLLRRDFTMNSMAIDTDTYEIVDPFNGIEDIEKKILRATSPAFSEDPLRVYRAARFAAKFNFEISVDTKWLMFELGPELQSLSTERVIEEMRKALRTDNPSVFFRTLLAAHVLEYHFPEVNNLVGVEQPEKSHPEGDVFEHTMQVLDRASELTKCEEIRFGALVHDWGKALTPRELWPKHHGHESAGVPLVEAFANRMPGLPDGFVVAGKVACEEHMRAHKWKEMSPGKLASFFERLKRTEHVLGVSGLAIVSAADDRGRNRPHADISKYLEMVALSGAMFQKVNGKTANITVTGKAFGEALHQKRSEFLSKVSHEWRI